MLLVYQNVTKSEILCNKDTQNITKNKIMDDIVTQNNNSKEITSDKLIITLIGVGSSGMKIVRQIPEIDGVCFKYLFVDAYLNDVKSINDWLRERNASESDMNIKYRFIEFGDDVNYSHPQYAYKLALKFQDEIKKYANNYYTIVVTALGGSTGLGASLAILETLKPSVFIANEVDLVCSIPFRFEKKRKRLAAMEGLVQLESVCRNSYIIDLSALDIDYNCSLLQAYEFADKAMADLVVRVCKKIIRYH